MGRHVTIKVMGFLVFPLIACFCSFHLFNGELAAGLSTSQMQLTPHTFHQIWISIPVMVFEQPYADLIDFCYRSAGEIRRAGHG